MANVIQLTQAQLRNPWFTSRGFYTHSTFEDLPDGKKLEKWRSSDFRPV